MSDQTLLRERLQMILDALERIPRRFAKMPGVDLNRRPVHLSIYVGKNASR